MKFLQWDLKQLSRGTQVQVTLKGNAANVRLMDIQITIITRQEEAIGMQEVW